MEEKHYRIIWTIDQFAESPLEAIKQAIASMPNGNPSSIATLFTVEEIDSKNKIASTQEIDLLSNEHEDKIINDLEQSLWDSPTGSPDV
jgi:hypothetical protein